MVCRGGTGTLVELAVVWEMLNKGVMRGKPMVAMGDFWRPVIECVSEAERGSGALVARDRKVISESRVRLTMPLLSSRAASNWRVGARGAADVNRLFIRSKRLGSTSSRMRSATAALLWTDFSCGNQATILFWLARLEFVSRPAEELLEFDALKDIVSGFTTCAPGRRRYGGARAAAGCGAPAAEFALVREAMAYLRGGSELGFGSLADPEDWLPRLAVPGVGAFER